MRFFFLFFKVRSKFRWCSYRPRERWKFLFAAFIKSSAKEKKNLSNLTHHSDMAYYLISSIIKQTSKKKMENSILYAFNIPIWIYIYLFYFDFKSLTLIVTLQSWIIKLFRHSRDKNQIFFQFQSKDDDYDDISTFYGFYHEMCVLGGVNSCIITCLIVTKRVSIYLWLFSVSFQSKIERFLRFLVRS